MVPQSRWAAVSVAGLGTMALYPLHESFLSLLRSSVFFAYNTHGLRRGLHSFAAFAADPRTS